MKKISEVIFNSSKNYPKAKLSKNASDQIARDILNNIQNELATTGRFSITGFGTFFLR